MIDPFSLIAQLKKLAVMFVGLLLGMAVLERLTSEMIPSGVESLLWLLLLLSPAAYGYRETQLRKRSRGLRTQTRGGERIPVAPNHRMEDNE